MCSEGWLAHHRHLVNESHLYFIGRRALESEVGQGWVTGKEVALGKTPCPPQSPLAGGPTRRSPPHKVPGPPAAAPVYSHSAERTGPSESSPAETCPAGLGEGLQQGFWKQDLTCFYTLCSLGSPGGDPQSCSPASVHYQQSSCPSYYFMAQYWTPGCSETRKRQSVQPKG